MWPLTPREHRIKRAEVQDETLPQEGLQLRKDGERIVLPERPKASPLRSPRREHEKKKEVVNAKRGQEIKIKSDSFSFGFSIQRSLVTLIRTGERG